ncbi:SIS domain-containing protein [Alphaproteobacteria bacterium]|nr:SIS domain-containing protein [Alphaproteobacteria bacterium]
MEIQNHTTSKTKEVYSASYLESIQKICQALDVPIMEQMVKELSDLRSRKGRLFILGVGGSAANCSHAVNDFRKLCGIETYAPTDNVSELTARTNDEGWETVFSEWLKVSHLSSSDALLIFSVGGGNKEKNVSTNLIKAIDVARDVGAKVLGIVGRDGGYTKQKGDCVVLIPTVDAEKITPLAEAFQGVVWHCFVSHPGLQVVQTKW